MRFAALFSIPLALMHPVSAAPSSSTPESEMSSITPYQQGIQALSDHLPELAVTRFAEAYKIPNLTVEQNREILYRLTEAQVRANQPEKALTTLNSKFFKNHPEREFWIAQALAAQGKFTESIERFKKLNPKSSYIDDATLTLASLQLALNLKTDAITSYQKATKSKDVLTKLKATTALAEIYLENGDFKRAKAMVNSIPKDSKNGILKKVLDAQLSLNSKDYPDAIEKFSGFFASDYQLHPRLHQIALIGLADARYAAGQVQEARLGLTDFISNHQDSPILLLAFERLSKWSNQPMTATDPFYLQLQKWSGRDSDSATDFGIRIGSDFIVNPLPTPNSLNTSSTFLRAIAHYYYAKHTAELETASSLAKGQFELSAFRLAYPEHPFFGASIFDTAKIQIQLKQRLDALLTLQTLAELAKNKSVTIAPEALAQAGFISGQLSVESEDYPEALKAFALATYINNKHLAAAAQINVALAALRSSDLAAFDAQKAKITDQQLTSQLSIERALWLAHQKHPDAREALKSFLLKHPESPRVVDARIALASICATQVPLYPLLSKALIDSVDSSTLSPEQLTNFTRTSFLLAELQQDWPAAIAAIDSYLEKFPRNKSRDEFRMRKGLTLYRNGEHNKARQLLGKIAMESPDSPLTEFCHYYAGMAARLEGTPQALKESIDIFEKVVRSKSQLSTDARIQQARVLLDIHRTEEAKISLNQVYKQNSDSPRQREIGTLLATALHTQGSEDPGQYAKAVAIYDQLLAHKNLSLSWSNQLHYMKGQALESMREPTQALNAYYQVINKENLDPQASEEQQEWKWFYQCGFKAIALLEKQQNFHAAVSVARKIASYGGPESEAYSKRARALEMQHMIWEE